MILNSCRRCRSGDSMLENITEIVRISACIVSFSFASYQDIKTREISSIIWFLAGSLGLSLLFVERGYLAIPSIISTALLFYPTFFEISSKSRKIMILIGIVVFIFCIIYTPIYYFISPPLVVLLGHLLHQTKVLRGGADAKAFMLIGIMFPTYPSTIFCRIPTGLEFYNIVFPFALLVILYATLCLLLLIPYHVIINVRRGKIKFPHMLVGYTIKIEDFGKKFVWLLEHVDNGKVFIRFSPMEEREKYDLEKFKEMGYKEVWVQPQIPFIAFMFLGFILAIVFGNPLFKLIKI